LNGPLSPRRCSHSLASTPIDMIILTAISQATTSKCQGGKEKANSHAST
jgi:hypothetical protein